jgi:hypothetical protein
MSPIPAIRTGMDSFEYLISGGDGGTAIATVNLDLTT